HRERRDPELRECRPQADLPPTSRRKSCQARPWRLCHRLRYLMHDGKRRVDSPRSSAPASPARTLGDARFLPANALYLAAMTARTGEAAAAGAAGRTWVVFGPVPIGVDEVVALAEGRAEAVLSDDPDWLARLEAGREVLARSLSEGEPVYGVSTGVGASVDN